jgi:HEPN domain-containing protein
MKRPNKEEALSGVIQAKDEFHEANTLRKMERFYLAQFHYQQATEKALKAFLYIHTQSIEIFYTHSISELIKLAIQIDTNFIKVEFRTKANQKLILFYSITLIIFFSLIRFFF